MWSFLLSATSAQELEELVDEGEREEEELRRIPGAELPGIGDEPISGRLRLPKGKETELVRISQDREIDPETYIVGPADVLQLYIWGEFDQATPVVVNPEGFALIPTIGAFDVADKTLAEVKEEIISAAQSTKYPAVDITLTLESMRYFTVYLTGAVLTEGAFAVHPITRISDLIDRGGGFVDDIRGSIEETVAGKKVTKATLAQAQPTARRSIRVTHRDGAVETVDLSMFLATGDLAHNPYLRMGDAVHVAFRTHEFFVYGSVNEEGSLEYRRGDTVGDLVELAGGISGSAPLEVAEVWRFRDDGVSSDVISLIESHNPGPADHVTLADIADVPLQPKDMLFLRTRADWQETPTVQIYGKVKYRGRYRIVPGTTRLADIIAEAGGLSERASLLEANVIRARLRNLQDPEYQRLRAVQSTAGMADMDPEERAYLKTKGRERRGHVVVDFERLFVENAESQNILLEGGDVIFIPETRRTVSLSGQLKKPGLIYFEEGRRAGYYIDQAGGYAFSANKGGARLIRARTGVREKLDKNAVVEPGDEIWIPEDEYRNWWEFFQGTMRTVAETLTLVVLVRAL